MKQHHLTVLVLFTLCCAWRTEAIGHTMPSGPIVGLVNGTINITCYINLEETKGVNSSALNWYTDGRLVDQRYVHIVNASAVQLLVTNAPPTKQPYICKLQTGRTEYAGVGYNDVTMGYMPQKVKNFKCKSANWQNMTCTFAKVENPVDSKYTLQFKVDRRDLVYFECKVTPSFDGSYKCELRIDSKEGIYRQTYPQYYFYLRSISPLGERVEEFTVDHYGSVVPDMPYKLGYKNVLPNSVTLVWQTPIELQAFPEDLIYSISYITKFDQTWHQLPDYRISKDRSADKSTDKSAEIEYELDALPYAHVQYDVRIRMRVARAADTPEMWSKNATIIFWSGSRIPDAPPATDVGAFYVDDNDHVYVYWRELRKYEENGPQFQYVVRSKHAELQKPTSNNFMAKYVNVKANAIEDLHVEISASNALGASTKTSSVRVPRRSQRCPTPGEIRNILHNNNNNNNHVSAIVSDASAQQATISLSSNDSFSAERYYVFSWAAPHNHTEPPITSYTVFWCRARSESPNQCDSGFNFTRVPANTTSYRHVAQNESLNFAVAANSDTSSSGMSWARCTAIANNDINKVTDTKPTVGSDRATFEWNTACIDESLSHGYVITYCLVQGERDNSNCSEQPQNITIPGAAVHNYTITALIPYRTYKVRIAAKSTQKIGPLSDPVYFTTLEASPTPPRSLSVPQVNSSCATLLWDPPAQMNGVLNRYIVYANDEKHDVPKMGSANNSMRHVLTGLQANTHYTFTVLACTGARFCSNASNTVQATTDMRSPGAVRLLANVRHGVISWLPPLQAGGNLDYYEVEVQRDGGEKRVVQLNGTHCTLAMAMCQSGEQSYSFRVRAVNLAFVPHGEVVEAARERREAANGTGTGTEGGQHSPVVWAGNATEHHHHHHSSGGQLCTEQMTMAARSVKAQHKYVPLAGEWLVVKNQDCRTTNRAMFAVLVAALFGVLLVAYFVGAFGYRKLKNAKDIFITMPPGIIIPLDTANGTSGGGCGAAKGAGNGLAGPKGGGGGGGIAVTEKTAGVGVGGLAVGESGRLTDVLIVGQTGAGAGAGMLGEKRPGSGMFVKRTEQEESLLPMRVDGGHRRSQLQQQQQHCSDGEDEQSSSGGHSMCEDSDGHDASSGRSLLMSPQSSKMAEIDKFLGFTGTNSPLMSQFTISPTVVLPVFVPPTVTPLSAEQLSAMKPTLFDGFNQPSGGGAGGYVDNAVPMLPPSTFKPTSTDSTLDIIRRQKQKEATELMQKQQVLQDEQNLKKAMEEMMQQKLKHQQQMQQQQQLQQQTKQPQPTTQQSKQPPMSNFSGYMPWNPIAAAALSTACQPEPGSVQTVVPPMSSGISGYSPMPAPMRMPNKAAAAAAAAAANQIVGDVETLSNRSSNNEENGGAVVVDGGVAVVAAEADQSSISGYVTHRQLSDFGHLMQ